MKILLLFALLCGIIPATAQSHFRLSRYPRTEPLPKVQGSAGIRAPATGSYSLAAVVIHKNRMPILSAPVPGEAVLQLELREPLPSFPAEARMIPLAGGSLLLVSGGYLGQERQERRRDPAMPVPVWPLGNELIGIVVLGGYPAPLPRP